MTRTVSASGQELVLLSCKDEGAGLSKANLKLLFGEGVQFNANELQAGGGSGFGLYITKGIVLLHKGANIWAESGGEGKGCTFFVELPLMWIAPSNSEDDESDSDSSSDSDSNDSDVNDSSAEPEASPSQPSQASSVGVAPRVRSTNSSVVQAVFKPRVLIVDDSAMSRRMLARMLEAEGFECVHAVDGLAAVAYVSRADMLHRRSDGEVARQTPAGGRSPTTGQAGQADGAVVSAVVSAGSSRGPSRQHSALGALPPVDELREQCHPAVVVTSGGSSRRHSALPHVDENRAQCLPSRQQSALNALATIDERFKQRGRGATAGVCLTPIDTPRQNESPDVILMDSNMPKMNGPDAVVEIRKLGFKSLILGVTGDADHAAFMRAGADGVMMKPVKGAELVKAIREALRNQQQT